MSHLTTARFCFPAPKSAVYGQLETLVLPQPGLPPIMCPAAGYAASVCGRSIEGDLHLLRQIAVGVRPSTLHAPEDPYLRTRYRWMVGHQVAFAVWQCLRRALLAAVHGPGPADQVVRMAARLHDVYSVLLLYAGSCSPQRYEATVRADMMARNPAMSGEWHRDYEGIPALVKRVQALFPYTVVRPLAEAAKANHRVHIAVAKKLVPDGISLLQQAGRQPGRPPSQAERDLCDDYFAVRRQLICEYTFTAQFIRRLAQTLCDITEYGLNDPDAPTAGFGSPHVRSVEALQNRAVALLRGLAEGLSAGRLLEV